MFRKLFTVLFMAVLCCAAAFGQKASQAAPQAKSALVSLDDMIRHAEAKFSVKDFGTARSICVEASAYYPGNARQEYMDFMIAKCYMNEGGWGYYRGYERMEQFLKKYPGSKNEAETKQMMKEIINVVQKWDMDPPLQTARENLAYKYIEFGDDFKGTSVDKTDVGNIYYPERLNQAFYWYKKVITEFPDTWVASIAQYRMGDAYVVQDKDASYKAAVEEYQKIVDTYPDSINYYSLKRRTLKQISKIYNENLRDKKQAIAALEKLLEMEKDNPDSYYVSYAKAQIEFLK